MYVFRNLLVNNFKSQFFQNITGGVCESTSELRDQIFNCNATLGSIRADNLKVKTRVDQLVDDMKTEAHNCLMRRGELRDTVSDLRVKYNQIDGRTKVGGTQSNGENEPDNVAVINNLVTSCVNGKINQLLSTLVIYYYNFLLHFTNKLF